MKRVLTVLVTALVLVATAAGEIESQLINMDVVNGRTYSALSGTDTVITAPKRMAVYPYQSINLNLYVSANDGDSATVVVAYQLTDLVKPHLHDTVSTKGHWPSKWTVIDTFYGSPNDTLRYQAQRFTANEYYPEVNPWIRFMAYGITGNDSLTVIDSFTMSGYRD